MERSCRLCGSVLTVKDTFEFCSSESSGPLAGRWSNRPPCGLLGLGEPGCEWLLSCLGRELSTALLWVISNIKCHLFCLKLVIPVWHRWIILLLCQPSVISGWDVYIVILKGMIFLLQMDVDSMVFTRGAGAPVLCHSFIERWFCLPNVQTYAFLAALNSILHYSVYAWVLCPHDGQVSASVCCYVWSEQKYDFYLRSSWVSQVFPQC